MTPGEDSMGRTSLLPRPAVRRGETGFFRADQDAAGCWWLFDPDGNPCLLRGVHGVRRPPSQTDGVLPADPAAQLRRWGFNAVGLGPDGTARDDGLPYLASVEFVRASPVIVAPGVRLPDVFSPEWPRQAAALASEVCSGSAADRQLVGWVTDGQLEWGQAGEPGRPSLLQVCLSLEPGYAAYHAAWEFVLALHAGKLDTLSRAWGVAVSNKEVVREFTRSEQGLATPGYLRDELRWAREFARRYFTVTAASVRAADPHHLVLGCRFAGRAGAAVLAECAYPAVDVALLDWRDVPSAGPGPLQPVLAGDVGWAVEALPPLLASARPRRLTTFERLLRRARTSLDRLARHPGVVGYFWAQWQDEPAEQPPFARGLIHLNGSEAREHTEVLAAFNQRAEALHRSSLPPATNSDRTPPA